jgi:hypothetical protein
MIRESRFLSAGCRVKKKTQMKSERSADSFVWALSELSPAMFDLVSVAANKSEILPSKIRL